MVADECIVGAARAGFNPAGAADLSARTPSCKITPGFSWPALQIESASCNARSRFAADSTSEGTGPVQLTTAKFKNERSISNEERSLKWCAQGDDFRTFLGDFVAALPQIEFPAELNL